MELLSAQFHIGPLNWRSHPSAPGRLARLPTSVFNPASRL